MFRIPIVNFLRDQTQLHRMILKDPSKTIIEKGQILMMYVNFNDNSLIKNKYNFKNSIEQNWFSFNFPRKQTERKEKQKPCNKGALMLREKREGRAEVIGRWVPL